MRVRDAVCSASTLTLPSDSFAPLPHCLQALAKFLISKGYKLTTEGTENHLMLWDLRPLGLTGTTACH